ncbi:hypothetical protein VC83_05112 [Pseudogymnoascus destructans]|uniref:Uncharacterized protein n=2 Tax=Pseudogymnoascus destructans TaxID=655981 RepID=L8FZ55_PSED2|nr:uncharacterized protein VC83_05112 [Pseudogymnoascus destructans]ELR05001.1 hypothetical protein GMDG_01572 [Pseudogymnoascus destructans 20631-21]OAF58592.1 hypothetical protein VC83_05112 [Pseudogymnoascus destructans]
MDEQPSSKQITAARLVGRLFGKKQERKGNQDEYVASFLQRPSSDTLHMNGADPNQNATPKLAKLDTLGAQRWPTAFEVIQSRDSSQARPEPRPSRPSHKGLVVRFTDKYPEIIGEGGDEAEAPTAHISASQKHAQSYPQASARQPPPRYRPNGGNDEQNDQERSNQPPKDPRSQPAAQAPAGQPWTPAAPILQPSASQRRANVPSNYGVPAVATGAATDPGHGALVARMQKEMKISEGQALIADQQNPRSSVQRRPVARGSNTPLESFSSQVADAFNGQPKSPGTDVSSNSPPPGYYSESAARSPKSNGGPTQNISPINAEPRSMARLVANLPAPSVVNNESLDEFAGRVGYLYKLFELSAESKESLSASSFENLLRAASWWFLRGRSTIEQVAKRRAPNSERVDILQQQGNADLAKCQWILSEILAHRPEIGDRSSDEITALERTALASGQDDVARLLERYQALFSNLRKLTGSMKKNNIMPPHSNDAILTQGLNTAIWVDYPWQDPSIQTLFSGIPLSSILSPKGPDSISSTEALPLGDTENMFTYSRIQVGVCLTRDGHEPIRQPLPCILSVQRERNDKLITAVISSQDGVISIAIQPRNGSSPTWQDVAWDTKRDLIDVKLGKLFRARVLFAPWDFPTLWNMYEYTSKVQTSFLAHSDEVFVMETTVRSAHYATKEPSDQIFPKDAALHCKVRVFEKVVVEKSINGPHTRHRGVRLAVATGPNTKSLCGITHDLPTQRPIRYEHTRVDYGASLYLYFGDGPAATIGLTFETNQDRFAFHNTIIGGQRPNESTAAVLPLKGFSLTRSAESQSTAVPRMVLDSFEWSALHVIIHNKGSDFNSTAVQSAGHLRIIAESQNKDRITDRLVLAPGELKIRISTKGLHPRLTILRSEQHDLIISCTESQTPAEVRQRLAQLLVLVAKVPTARHYSFATHDDMHEFQRAITGFSVLFSGTAATFAISRRRMVVPIHKKWETQAACVQLLESDGVVQLVAFFEGFSHGESMNFVLKPTDSFESFNKGGNYGVKLADAKFVLPVQDEAGMGAENGFVCLDQLEYPVEHDDIIVTFDVEDERDRFAKALPSETKHVFRFGSTKRRGE